MASNKSECLREQAKQVFETRNINITSKGRPNLGAAIGSQNFTNDYLRDKVEEWSNELSSLEAAAKMEPHLGDPESVELFNEDYSWF